MKYSSRNVSILGQPNEQANATSILSTTCGSFLRPKMDASAPKLFAVPQKTHLPQTRASTRAGRAYSTITFKILPPQYVDENKYWYIEFYRPSVPSSNAKHRHQAQTSEYRNRGVAPLCFDTSVPLCPLHHHDQNTAALNTTTYNCSAGMSYKCGWGNGNHWPLLQ